MISKDQLFISDEQTITLHSLDHDGYILDIRRSTENIIGKLHPASVVSAKLKTEDNQVDTDSPLRVLMDPESLAVGNACFHTATLFFTLMSLDMEQKCCLLEEVHRVLRPGGYLHIWDVTIPPPIVKAPKIYVVPIRVVMPQQKLKAMFGVYWADHQQTMIDISTLARKVGFFLQVEHAYGDVFYFHLQKMTR